MRMALEPCRRMTSLPEMVLSPATTEKSARVAKLETFFWFDRAACKSRESEKGKEGGTGVMGGSSTRAQAPTNPTMRINKRPLTRKGARRACRGLEREIREPSPGVPSSPAPAFQ